MYPPPGGFTQHPLSVHFSAAVLAIIITAAAFSCWRLVRCNRRRKVLLRLEKLTRAGWSPMLRDTDK